MKSKPQIRLSLTKESPKKPQLSIQTPHHKCTSSMLTAKSSASLLTTKARPSFSSFLSPNASKSMPKPKHQHTMSQQFLIPVTSPRLIRIPKADCIEDKAL